MVDEIFANIVVHTKKNVPFVCLFKFISRNACVMNDTARECVAETISFRSALKIYRQTSNYNNKNKIKTFIAFHKV